ncbi:hypothetical protein DL95DRAFT_522785 [Leptodontidium sp. 2 PMI_412]|nr:hypothetical protein DL95DRAFT_522785 [Leptodontidium sp. 2 PMI_412]
MSPWHSEVEPLYSSTYPRRSGVDTNQNARVFESAIEKLKQAISPPDAVAFQTTLIEDVWKAAEEIQESQRRRKSLRNMRRVEPFLKGLEKYSKVIEVVCNGTPYLPWIWLADEYTNVFDNLVDAYQQIAEAMPQFERLQAAFRDQPNLQAILAMIYEDILEFPRRAYKFFRRRSWHLFFDSLWKSFDFRFNGILKNLAHHKQLLHNEAVTIDIVAARQWRSQARELIVQQEKNSQDYYFHDSISWLKVADEQHDDKLERLADKRQDGTCEWIFRNSLFQNWKDDVHGELSLWVKGILGAGKTILSTYMIKQMQKEEGFTTAYHICNSYMTGKNLLGEIFRSITVQFLRSNLELAPFIFENYANKGLAPSIARLRKLLPELIATLSSIRIVIDGLDEYPESDQRIILTDLFALSKLPGSQCKILFSNREGKQINKSLTGKPTISLRDHGDVSKDIETYVRANLDSFRGGPLDENSLIDWIERMVLWVRLVLLGLEDSRSEQDLVDTVNNVPDGLEQAYSRILEGVANGLSEQSRDKALRILEWLACSFRIMKTHEIRDGIQFHVMGMELNNRAKVKLIDGFFDLCKPLVEEGPKNTVDFVHYFAKHPHRFVLDQKSGPFLEYHQSHYDLSFACMNYMNTSLCFIDPRYTENALQIRVVKGFHGLHHYANEFWFQHILQYAKTGNTVQDEDLDGLLDQIREFWKADPGVGAETLKLDDTNSAEVILSQLESLESIEQAQKMGIDILTSSSSCRKKITAIKTLKVDLKELKRDPTHFSAIKGIELEEFEKFKEICLDSAFICRYRECNRYSDGFQTSTDRDEHERLHNKSLRCADLSCDFFGRGFTSKSSLNKHNRKYHPTFNEKELPKFEPRKEEDSDNMATPPPQAPPTLPQAPRRAASPRARSPPPQPNRPERQPPRPREERVSRAKKGLPVHQCDTCPKLFTRNERLQYDDTNSVIKLQGSCVRGRAVDERSIGLICSRDINFGMRAC